MDWAHAYGPPEASACIRNCPEDFQVDEELGFSPDGEGQHLLLRIRKRNTNTEWLARQLARLAEVRSSDVSYAGLKDRNAVATQWFSVDLAGRQAPDWSALDSENIQVLDVVPHRRKLRRGALKGNRFILLLREVKGDRPQLEQRLQQIKSGGVPNYFGEQRFGRDGNNLAAAVELFSGRRVKDRHKRSLYLSAARSLLFNQVLSRRVGEGNWNQPLYGDAMQLDGSGSFFVSETVDADIRQRTMNMDIHPTGPLWGRGGLQSQAEVRQLEQDALREFTKWCTGLERAGLSQARRALRLPLRELSWSYPEADSVKLQFALPAGSYATAVLRELLHYHAG